MRLHAEPEALGDRPGRHRGQHARARRGRGASTAADLVLVGPSNPVVSIGPILGRPGTPGGAPGRARRRWSGSPGSSAAPPCSGWRTGCCRRSASRWTPARSGGTTARGADGGVLDAWVMDIGDARRGRAARGRRAARRGRRPGDEQPGGHGGVRPARGRRSARDRLIDRVCRARPGSARSSPGDDLVADGPDRVGGRPGRPAARRRRRRRDVEDRQQGRGRGGAAPDRAEAAIREAACTRWPGAARPGSSGPGTGLVLAAAGVDNSNVEPGRGPAAAASTPTPARPCSVPRCRPRRRTGRRRRLRHRSAGPGGWARPTGRSARPGSGSSTDYAGRRDAYGNDLQVTAVARGRRARRGGRPGQGQARPGGRSPWSAGWPTWSPTTAGTGADDLVRAAARQDMFGHGSQEAVLAAVLAALGQPERYEELARPGAGERAAALLRPGRRCARPWPAAAALVDGPGRADAPARRNAAHSRPSASAVRAGPQA